MRASDNSFINNKNHVLTLEKQPRLRDPINRLDKALEHSRPQVRKCAEKAKKSLLRETDDASSSSSSSSSKRSKGDRSGQRDRAAASKAATHALTLSMKSTRAGAVTTRFVIDAAHAVLDEL